MKEKEILKTIAKAKAAVAGLPVDGDEELLDNYMEIVYGTVLLSEEYSKELGDRSYLVAPQVRDFLKYGEPMEGYDHLLDRLFYSSSRIERCLSNHPRLMLQLQSFRLKLIRRLTASYEDETSEEEYIESEVWRISSNIEHADKGEYDKINDTRHLKNDPVEWTAEFEDVIDEAQEEAVKSLGDFPRGLGFCHAYWPALSAALAKRGIHWRSPHEMNPRVMFD